MDLPIFWPGAAAMDDHFRDAPLADNIPVLLGLLRVWNRNLMGLPTHGIMPYDQRLALVPAWAQQLEMESNGKSVAATGDQLGYDTTPVIWGAAGTGCQHSFFEPCIRDHRLYRWIFWCRFRPVVCILRATGMPATACWWPMRWLRPKHWPWAVRMKMNRIAILPATGPPH